MNLDLILKDIKDPYVRENFFRIQQALALQAFSDFKFFQVNLGKGTKIAVAHGLSFVPQDIIVTSILGDQNVFFNYMDFDSKNLYITSRGPCTLRFFAGSYDSKAYITKKTDAAFVKPDTIDVVLDVTIDGGDAFGD